MKLSLRAILVLLFIGFAIKVCGDDGSPRTGKGSRLDDRPQAAANVQALRQAGTSGPAAALASPQPKTLYVGPKSLNVRASPNGKVVASLKRGAPVEVHAQESGWSRISAEEQVPEWVSTTHLCASADCSDTRYGKATPAAPARAVPARQAAAASAGSTHGCPCSSSGNCYGPRGGRYCITSGGNKRYR